MHNCTACNIYLKFDPDLKACGMLYENLFQTVLQAVDYFGCQSLRKEGFRD